MSQELHVATADDPRIRRNAKAGAKPGGPLPIVMLLLTMGLCAFSRIDDGKVFRQFMEDLGFKVVVNQRPDPRVMLPRGATYQQWQSYRRGR